MAKKAATSPDDLEGELGTIVPLSLTDTERITYQKAAERCGLSLEDWIRGRLNEAAKREAKES
jgi:hypothetical protein